jgi:hypothetical protein
LVNHWQQLLNNKPNGTSLHKYDNWELPDSGDDKYNDVEEVHGPVIVPYDQIEASILGLPCNHSRFQSNTAAVGGEKWQCHHHEEYPLLYAMLSPGKGKVMVCTRILDKAGDVTLVRKAAVYSEEVEVHKGG